MIDLIEQIKEQTDKEVLFVCKAGSSLFCKNCKDNDYVIVVKGGNEYSSRASYESNDFFYYSENAIKHSLSSQHRLLINLIEFALAEHNADNVIYGENPLKDFYFSDDFKKSLINQLIIEAKQGDCNKRLFNSKNRDACLKRSIWLFANYFAITNNSLDFTKEQLDIIQKCHDNELPRSYAYAVYNKLLRMQRELTDTEV